MRVFSLSEPIAVLTFSALFSLARSSLLVTEEIKTMCDSDTIDTMAEQNAVLSEQFQEQSQANDAGARDNGQCPTWLELKFINNPTIEVTIPFAAPHKFPTSGTPTVRMTINGRYAGPVQMDTGSTAITIGKGTWVQNFNGNWDEAVTHEKGWKFLSSSRLLYTGYWVPTDLVFHGARDVEENLMTARVPVLVFDHRYHCPNFQTSDGPNCYQPDLANSVEGMITGLYMGIGFGREQDGMTMCTPDKNPFLNINSVRGEALRPDSNYVNGYIVRSDGVTWGLTTTNIADFRFTKLDKQPAATDTRDWAMANVTVKVGDGEDFRVGKILADTGVTQMYLSSPDVPKPILNTYKIDIRMPDAKGSLGGYEVTAVQGGVPISSIPGTAPSSIGATNTNGIVSGPGNGTLDRVFVNTGSRFYVGFEAAFDAVGGHWGVKKKIV